MFEHLLCETVLSLIVNPFIDTTKSEYWDNPVLVYHVDTINNHTFAVLSQSHCEKEESGGWM